MQSKMRDGALRSIPPALAAIQETNRLSATPPSLALRLLALHRGGERHAQATPGHLLAHPCDMLWRSHARFPGLLHDTLLPNLRQAARPGWPSLVSSSWTRRLNLRSGCAQASWRCRSNVTRNFCLAIRSLRTKTRAARSLEFRAGSLEIRFFEVHNWPPVLESEKGNGRIWPAT